MAIKIPLGTWALVLLAALMSLTAAGRRPGPLIPADHRVY
jgi:predicted small lipoprotein YifL